jgi:hypothetical protein
MKALALINVDVDLLGAVQQGGEVCLAIYPMGKAYKVVAQAPSKDRDGRSRLEWMKTGKDGKTAPLGQTNTIDVTLPDGKTVKCVRNITVGCAHMNASDSSDA